MELELKQIVKINSKTKAMLIYITAENVNKLGLVDGQEITVVIKTEYGGGANAQSFR